MTDRKFFRIVALIVGIILVVGVVAVWLATHQSWVGEQPDSADYVHKTIGLLTDLPHATAELVYSQIDNLLSWIVVAFVVRRYVTRKVEAEHKRLDEEHGYDHEDHDPS